ncbi:MULTISPECIES: hypothetical protein [Streptomyces]|jgi:hypothetical protein|uniref:Uncharacterized protein n=1 Tax=Streptomyces radiopugnans TaxID=403935 RepID=A0A1H9FQX5_9ACTN|nr:hypothetical protein [Streptomyces radiopugnans]URN11193.1 hypothetical protein LUW77_02175 [Streptomyces radiopugnans]SEQ40341.1 hypothetical protein SAMN05216481_107142 [Streptomyces radiopugnans]
MGDVTDETPPQPPIIVWGVTHGDRPFRTVQVRGEPVGLAHDLTDVVRLAYDAGLSPVDLDDPATVRWVGGDKYTWA